MQRQPKGERTQMSTNQNQTKQCILCRREWVLAERTDMLHHGSDRECTEYKVWRQKEDQWLLMNVERIDKHREDSQGAQSFI